MEWERLNGQVQDQQRPKTIKNGQLDAIRMSDALRLPLVRQVFGPLQVDDLWRRSLVQPEALSKMSRDGKEPGLRLEEWTRGVHTVGINALHALAVSSAAASASFTGSSPLSSSSIEERAALERAINQMLPPKNRNKGHKEPGAKNHHPYACLASTMHISKNRLLKSLHPPQGTKGVEPMEFEQ